MVGALDWILTGLQEVGWMRALCSYLKLHVVEVIGWRLVVLGLGLVDERRGLERHGKLCA